MAALTFPSANCLLLIDENGGDRQTGVVSSGGGNMLKSWLLAIPAGSSANAVAVAFANSMSFPSGSVAILIDLSVTPPSFSGWQLQVSWAAD